jgi:polyisoprenoid-binding protein YceI
MSAANAIAAPTWNIDPAHSTAEFKVKHMMISNVKGQFSAISGVLSLDEYDVAKSQVEASIEVGSINTHNPIGTRTSRALIFSMCRRSRFYRSARHV